MRSWWNIQQWNGSQEELFLPWGRYRTNVCCLGSCLSHSPACLFLYNWVPQPKVPDTKLWIYYQTSNLCQRQQNDTIKSQETGMRDYVQMVMQCLISPGSLPRLGLEGCGHLRVCHPAPPCTTYPCALALWLVFSIHRYDDSSTRLTGLWWGVNEDTMSATEGAFDSIHYNWPKRVQTLCPVALYSQCPANGNCLINASWLSEWK